MVTRAKEIMHSDVLTVPSESDALSVARRMAAQHLGYAVLVEGTNPVGIVTEWDFLEKVLAKEADAAHLPVSAIASRPLITCGPDMSTVDVVQLMSTKGVRRILVADQSRVLGVITSKDVIRVFREYVDKISADIARLQPTLQ